MMRKLIFGIGSFSLSAIGGHAADLVVEENGVGPNFASIQDAVTAAAPGDRIFIKNKSGNIPYQENVTIDKPLELLPFTADGSFLVQGGYTISANGSNFTAPDESVRIIGMNNTSGSILATANNATGNPIRIDILGNQLDSGSITISGTGFISHVAGNWLANGSVTTRAATICGNLINGSIVVEDASGTFDDDTMYIVGNRLCTVTGMPTSGQIDYFNNDQFLHIANNHIRTTNSVLIGFLSGTFSSIRTGGENLIVNNSLEGVGASSHWGIYVHTGNSSVDLTIENNAFHDQATGDGSDVAIYFLPTSAGQVGIHYNSYDGWGGGFILSNSPVTDVGNVENATLDPDDLTGVCSDAGSIDMGHPGSHHTDHDLTRNDVGVAGGSYNYNNFWPILTGGARVYLVKTPRTVVQGSTINAEADAHDR